MKNKLLSFLFALLTLTITVTSATAQDLNLPASADQGFTSVSEAAKMAREIVEVAGLKANFKIAEARVPNAMAVVQAGKRYVLYNPAFISILTEATGTKWSAVSVLAHEIGHHLYSPSVNRGKSPMANELEADEFSGFVLRKMGASEEEASAAIMMLASVRASDTHPGRDDRILAISKGWRQTGSFQGNPNGVAMVTSSPRHPESETNTEGRMGVPEKNILAAISFDADPSTEYFLTSRLNVIKLKNNKVFIIGKLARSDSRNFPYIIRDESDTRVYVSPSGNLVNSKGAKVGKMSLRS
ncbi:MAG: hypothetical protein H7Y42_19995 [Chitinophagaceae bacterium]|nr:hypothetical protein [Chitinophagaceae bacterium]